MPEDVQLKVLKSIPGLEDVTMVRAGYGVEVGYSIRSGHILGLTSLHALCFSSLSTTSSIRVNSNVSLLRFLA